MESGFSSPRAEAFPAGLRVLVVDDDLTWLKILEKMLKKCSYEDAISSIDSGLWLIAMNEEMELLRKITLGNLSSQLAKRRLLVISGFSKRRKASITGVEAPRYKTRFVVKGFSQVEVTTCGLAIDALKLLRERKDRFDIVISDVNMPDMDGFKLLEHVGLEMDLPVIMMSVDGETSRVMKGVQHGACDYLLKPIRMKELRNIWQHVFRKRMHEVRDIESHEGIEDFQMFRSGNEHSDDRLSLSGGDQTLGKKRKDAEYRHDDKEWGDTSSAKKPRVVWSVDLHQKFVKAVNQMGFDKVGPKKILDLMNVPWLTRENVASHLQKYRLYLSRLQKENEMKTYAGMINLDNSSNDSSVRFDFGHDSFTSMQQSHSDCTKTKFTCPASQLPGQTVHSDSHEIDQRGISSLPLTGNTKSIHATVYAAQKRSSSPTIDNHGIGSMESSINLPPRSSPDDKYQMVGKVPDLQFKYESDPHGQLGDLFSNADLLQSVPGINPDGSIKESPKVGMDDHEMKPLNSKHIVKDIKELFILDSKSGLLNSEALEPPFSNRFDMKNYITCQNSVTNQESYRKNQVSEVGSAFGSLNEDTKYCWLEGDDFTTNLGFDSLASPGMITEIPIHLYGALKFDYEYPSDLVEYPVVDQGLFIA
ncbi:hypothetical protein Dimus_031890 [Dionaea muscipula]